MPREILSLYKQNKRTTYGGGYKYTIFNTIIYKITRIAPGHHDNLLGGHGPVQLFAVAQLANGSFGNITSCEMSHGGGHWNTVDVKGALRNINLSNALLK